MIGAVALAVGAAVFLYGCGSEKQEKQDLPAPQEVFHANRNYQTQLADETNKKGVCDVTWADFLQAQGDRYTCLATGVNGQQIEDAFKQENFQRPVPFCAADADEKNKDPYAGFWLSHISHPVSILIPDLTVKLGARFTADVLTNLQKRLDEAVTALTAGVTAAKTSDASVKAKAALAEAEALLTQVTALQTEVKNIKAGDCAKKDYAAELEKLLKGLNERIALLKTKASSGGGSSNSFIVDDGAGAAPSL